MARFVPSLVGVCTPDRGHLASIVTVRKQPGEWETAEVAGHDFEGAARAWNVELLFGLSVPLGGEIGGQVS